MAQLPPDGEWLIQQIGERVILFNRNTEQELITFDPSSAQTAAIAQGEIHFLEELTAEQRAFAHFWSGYFYAHASSGGLLAGLDDQVDEEPWR